MLGTVQSIARSIADTADKYPRGVAQQLVIGTKLFEVSNVCIQQFAGAVLLYDLTTGARDFISTVYNYNENWSEEPFNRSNVFLITKEMASGAKDFLNAVKFFTCSDVDSPLKKFVDSVNAVVDLYYGWETWSEFRAGEKFYYDIELSDDQIGRHYWKPVEYGCERVSVVAKVALAISGH